ncbi:hypothetical protein SCG7109_AM_00050 [Chlamydiales bacterium SCGC AG-110-M15]|nr:hypothetical protein SCG7109_AM_00050 [Chlamydiales bacterium SCGC AG-110-M15]
MGLFHRSSVDSSTYLYQATHDNSAAWGIAKDHGKFIHLECSPKDLKKLKPAEVEKIAKSALSKLKAKGFEASEDIYIKLNHKKDGNYDVKVCVKSHSKEQTVREYVLDKVFDESGSNAHDGIQGEAVVPKALLAEEELEPAPAPLLAPEKVEGKLTLMSSKGKEAASRTKDFLRYKDSFSFSPLSMLGAFFWGLSCLILGAGLAYGVSSGRKMRRKTERRKGDLFKQESQEAAFRAMDAAVDLETRRNGRHLDLVRDVQTRKNAIQEAFAKGDRNEIDQALSELSIRYAGEIQGLPVGKEAVLNEEGEESEPAVLGGSLRVPMGYFTDGRYQMVMVEFRRDSEDAITMEMYNDDPAHPVCAQHPFFKHQLHIPLDFLGFSEELRGVCSDLDSAIDDVKKAHQLVIKGDFKSAEEALAIMDKAYKALESNKETVNSDEIDEIDEEIKTEFAEIEKQLHSVMSAAVNTIKSREDKELKSFEEDFEVVNKSASQIESYANAFAGLKSSELREVEEVEVGKKKSKKKGELTQQEVDKRTEGWNKNLALLSKPEEEQNELGVIREKIKSYQNLSKKELKKRSLNELDVIDYDIAQLCVNQSIENLESMIEAGRNVLERLPDQIIEKRLRAAEVKLKTIKRRNDKIASGSDNAAKRVQSLHTLAQEIEGVSGSMKEGAWKGERQRALSKILEPRQPSGAGLDQDEKLEEEEAQAARQKDLQKEYEQVSGRYRDVKSMCDKLMDTYLEEAEMSTSPKLQEEARMLKGQFQTIIADVRLVLSNPDLPDQKRIAVYHRALENLRGLLEGEQFNKPDLNIENSIVSRLQGLKASEGLNAYCQKDIGAGETGKGEVMGSSLQKFLLDFMKEMDPDNPSAFGPQRELEGAADCGRESLVKWGVILNNADEAFQPGEYSQEENKLIRESSQNAPLQFMNRYLDELSRGGEEVTVENLSRWMQASIYQCRLFLQCHKDLNDYERENAIRRCQVAIGLCREKRQALIDKDVDAIPSGHLPKELLKLEREILKISTPAAVRLDPGKPVTKIRGKIGVEFEKTAAANSRETFAGNISMMNAFTPEQQAAWDQKRVDLRVNVRKVVKFDVYKLRKLNRKEIESELKITAAKVEAIGPLLESFGDVGIDANVLEGMGLNANDVDNIETLKEKVQELRSNLDELDTYLSSRTGAQDALTEMLEQCEEIRKKGLDEADPQKRRKIFDELELRTNDLIDLLPSTYLGQSSHPIFDLLTGELYGGGATDSFARWGNILDGLEENLWQARMQKQLLSGRDLDSATPEQFIRAWKLKATRSHLQVQAFGRARTEYKSLVNQFFHHKTAKLPNAISSTVTSYCEQVGTDLLPTVRRGVGVWNMPSAGDERNKGLIDSLGGIEQEVWDEELVTAKEIEAKREKEAEANKVKAKQRSKAKEGKKAIRTVEDDNSEALEDLGKMELTEAENLELAKLKAIFEPLEGGEHEPLEGEGDRKGEVEEGAEGVLATRKIDSDISELIEREDALKNQMMGLDEKSRVKGLDLGKLSTKVRDLKAKIKYVSNDGDEESPHQKDLNKSNDLQAEIEKLRDESEQLIEDKNLLDQLVTLKLELGDLEKAAERAAEALAEKSEGKPVAGASKKGFFSFFGKGKKRDSAKKTQTLNEQNQENQDPVAQKKVEIANLLLSINIDNVAKMKMEDLQVEAHSITADNAGKLANIETAEKELAEVQDRINSLGDVSLEDLQGEIFKKELESEKAIKFITLLNNAGRELTEKHKTQSVKLAEQKKELNTQRKMFHKALHSCAMELIQKEGDGGVDLSGLEYDPGQMSTKKEARLYHAYRKKIMENPKTLKQLQAYCTANTFKEKFTEEHSGVDFAHALKMYNGKEKIKQEIREDLRSFEKVTDSVFSSFIFNPQVYALGRTKKSQEEAYKRQGIAARQMVELSCPQGATKEEKEKYIERWSNLMNACAVAPRNLTYGKYLFDDEEGRKGFIYDEEGPPDSGRVQQAMFDQGMKFYSQACAGLSQEMNEAVTAIRKQFDQQAGHEYVNGTEGAMWGMQDPQQTAMRFQNMRKGYSRSKSAVSSGSIHMPLGSLEAQQRSDMRLQILMSPTPDRLMKDLPEGLQGEVQLQVNPSSSPGKDLQAASYQVVLDIPGRRNKKVTVDPDRAEAVFDDVTSDDPGSWQGTLSVSDTGEEYSQVALSSHPKGNDKTAADGVGLLRSAQEMDSSLPTRLRLQLAALNRTAGDNEEARVGNVDACLSVMFDGFDYLGDEKMQGILRAALFNLNTLSSECILYPDRVMNKIEQLQELIRMCDDEEAIGSNNPEKRAFLLHICGRLNEELAHAEEVWTEAIKEGMEGPEKACLALHMYLAGIGKSNDKEAEKHLDRLCLIREDGGVFLNEGTLPQIQEARAKLDITVNQQLSRFVRPTIVQLRNVEGPSRSLAIYQNKEDEEYPTQEEGLAYHYILDAYRGKWQQVKKEQESAKVQLELNSLEQEKAGELAYVRRNYNRKIDRTRWDADYSVEEVEKEYKLRLEQIEQKYASKQPHLEASSQRTPGSQFKKEDCAHVLKAYFLLNSQAIDAGSPKMREQLLNWIAKDFLPHFQTLSADEKCEVLLNVERLLKYTPAGENAWQLLNEEQQPLCFTKTSSSGKSVTVDFSTGQCDLKALGEMQNREVMIPRLFRKDAKFKLLFGDSQFKMRRGISEDGKIRIYTFERNGQQFEIQQPIDPKKRKKINIYRLETVQKKGRRGRKIEETERYLFHIPELSEQMDSHTSDLISKHGLWLFQKKKFVGTERRKFLITNSSEAVNQQERFELVDGRLVHKSGKELICNDSYYGFGCLLPTLHGDKQLCLYDKKDKAFNESGIDRSAYRLKRRSNGLWMVYRGDKALGRAILPPPGSAKDRDRARFQRVRQELQGIAGNHYEEFAQVVHASKKRRVLPGEIKYKFLIVPNKVTVEGYPGKLKFDQNEVGGMRDPLVIDYREGGRMVGSCQAFLYLSNIALKEAGCANSKQEKLHLYKRALDFLEQAENSEMGMSETDQEMFRYLEKEIAFEASGDSAIDFAIKLKVELAMERMHNLVVDENLLAADPEAYKAKLEMRRSYFNKYEALVAQGSNVPSHFKLTEQEYRELKLVAHESFGAYSIGGDESPMSSNITRLPYFSVRALNENLKDIAKYAYQVMGQFEERDLPGAGELRAVRRELQPHLGTDRGDAENKLSQASQVMVLQVFKFMMNVVERSKPLTDENMKAVDIKNPEDPISLDYLSENFAIFYQQILKGEIGPEQLTHLLKAPYNVKDPEERLGVMLTIQLLVFISSYQKRGRKIQERADAKLKPGEDSKEAFVSFPVLTPDDNGRCLLMNPLIHPNGPSLETLMKDLMEHLSERSPEEMGDLVEGLTGQEGAWGMFKELFNFVGKASNTSRVAIAGHVVRRHGHYKRRKEELLGKAPEGETPESLGELDKLKRFVAPYPKKAEAHLLAFAEMDVAGMITQGIDPMSAIPPSAETGQAKADWKGLLRDLNDPSTPFTDRQRDLLTPEVEGCAKLEANFDFITDELEDLVGSLDAYVADVETIYRLLDKYRDTILATRDIIEEATAPKAPEGTEAEGESKASEEKGAEKGVKASWLRKKAKGAARAVEKKAKGVAKAVKKVAKGAVLIGKGAGIAMSLARDKDKILAELERLNMQELGEDLKPFIDGKIEELMACLKGGPKPDFDIDPTVIFANTIGRFRKVSEAVLQLESEIGRFLPEGIDVEKLFKMKSKDLLKELSQMYQDGLITKEQLEKVLKIVAVAAEIESKVLASFRDEVISCLSRNKIPEEVITHAEGLDEKALRKYLRTQNMGTYLRKKVERAGVKGLKEANIEADEMIEFLKAGKAQVFFENEEMQMKLAKALRRIAFPELSLFAKNTVGILKDSKPVLKNAVGAVSGLMNSLRTDGSHQDMMRILDKGVKKSEGASASVYRTNYVARLQEQNRALEGDFRSAATERRKAAEAQVRALSLEAANVEEAAQPAIAQNGQNALQAHPDGSKLLQNMSEAGDEERKDAAVIVPVVGEALAAGPNVEADGGLEDVQARVPPPLIPTRESLGELFNQGCILEDCFDELETKEGGEGRESADVAKFKKQKGELVAALGRGSDYAKSVCEGANKLRLDPRQLVNYQLKPSRRNLRNFMSMLEDALMDTAREKSEALQTVMSELRTSDPVKKEKYKKFIKMQSQMEGAAFLRALDQNYMKSSFKLEYPDLYDKITTHKLALRKYQQVVQASREAEGLEGVLRGIKKRVPIMGGAKKEAALRSRGQNEEKWKALSQSIYHTLRMGYYESRYNDEGFLQENKSKLLVAECRSGRIFRKSQLEILKEAVEDPTMVEELRMGQGKTSMILPTLLSIFSEKGKFCGAVLPQALLGAQRGEIDEATRGIYDQSGYTFHFSRDSVKGHRTVEELEEAQVDLMKQYNALLSVRKNKDYFLTSVESKAALTCKINEFELEKAKLLEAGGGVDKRKVILMDACITEMRRIQDLLEDKDTLFIIDEVDGVLHPKNDVRSQLSSQGIPDEVTEVCSSLVFDLFQISKNEPGEGAAAEREEKVQAEVEDALAKVQEAILAKETGALDEDTVKTVQRYLCEKKITELIGDNFGDFEYLEDGSQGLIDAIVNAVVNGTELGDFYKGWDRDLPEDVRTKLGVVIMAMQNVFPSILKERPGVNYGMDGDNGFMVVPLVNRMSLKNIRYSVSVVQAMRNMMCYASMPPRNDICEAYFRSAEGVPEDLALLWEDSKKKKGVTAEKLLQHNAKDSPELQMRKLRARLKLSAKKTKEIEVAEDQVKKGVQAAMGRANILGMTGTIAEHLRGNQRKELELSSEGRFNLKHAKSRVVIADVFLRLGNKHPSGRKEKPFEIPLETYSSKAEEQLQEFMQTATERRGGDFKYQFVINQAGLLDSLSAEQMAKRLHESSGRPVVFIKRKGTKAEKYICDKGVMMPYKKEGEADKEVLFYFDVPDTRGVDFKMQKFASGRMFMASRVNAEDFSQAAYRARGLGETQGMEILISNKLKSAIQAKAKGPLEVKGEVEAKEAAEVIPEGGGAI